MSSTTSCRFDSSVIRSSADRIVHELRSLIEEMQSVEKLNKEQIDILKSLLAITVEIEIIKARSEMVLNEKIREILQERLKNALERYKKMYISIIRDFTEDVISNLEHFIKLAKENLDPLRKIVESMKKLLEEIETINPIEEDLDLLNAAIAMYNKRESVARTYLEREQSIHESIEKVKKSKQSFIDNLKNVLLTEIEIKDPRAILLIPTYVIKIKTKSGETKTIIIPLSKLRDHKDLLDKMIAPKNISETLKEKIELSIQKKKEILKFREPDNETKEKAKKLLAKLAKNSEEEEIMEEAIG